MSGFARTISDFFNKLSIPNLIQIFLFLFLLLAVPLTVLSIKQTRDTRSLASGWSISLSPVSCTSYGPSGRATLYSTTTIPAGYDTGYIDLYLNGQGPVVNTYDTYPGHANQRVDTVGPGPFSAYVTLRSDATTVQATSQPVTWDCRVAPCQNTCTHDVCANNTSYQKCSDSNGDTCLELSPVQSCSPGQTCSGNGSCGCNNECSSGAQQCVNSTSFKTCSQVGSCWKWSTASCPPGQTCSGNACSTPGGGGGGGGGGSGGKKTSGGGGGTGSSLLGTLQLEVSVPYLVGTLKLKADVGGASKEIQVSGSNKSASLDFTGSNLPLNKEYNLVLTSDKTLVRKVKFTPTAASTILNAGELILGDVNQDNTIDAKDKTALMNSVADQTSLGDLNADSVANSMDWAILLTNFGKTGD